MRAVRNRKVSVSWLLEVWCLLRTVRNRERPCRGNVLFFWRLASLRPWELSVMDRCPLSSAKVPAGYPHQNKIIEKIESARGTMGRGKLPIVPRALSCSFSPASPQHKEASAEEGGQVSVLERWRLYEFWYLHVGLRELSVMESCLYYKGGDCTKFGIYETMRIVRNRGMSISYWWGLYEVLYLYRTKRTVCNSELPVLLRWWLYEVWYLWDHENCNTGNLGYHFQLDGLKLE